MPSFFSYDFLMIVTKRAQAAIHGTWLGDIHDSVEISTTPAQATVNADPSTAVTAIHAAAIHAVVTWYRLMVYLYLSVCVFIYPYVPLSIL